jgi:hypothetical protein
MADFTLARESCEEERDFNVGESKFDNQASETRLLSSGVLLGFKVKSPNLTYTKLQEYISFYNGKYGSLTSFTVVNPFDGITYNVRFRKGSFKTTYVSGIFQCEFNLDRVF